MTVDKFGMYAKFTAKPGERDQLVGILLEAPPAPGAFRNASCMW